MKKILKNKTVIAILVICTILALSFGVLTVIEKYNENNFQCVLMNMNYLMEINLSLIDDTYEVEDIKLYFDRLDVPILPKTKQLYKKAMMSTSDNYTNVFYEIDDEFYRLNAIAEKLYEKEKEDVE